MLVGAPSDGRRARWRGLGAGAGRSWRRLHRAGIVTGVPVVARTPVTAVLSASRDLSDSGRRRPIVDASAGRKS